MYCSIFNNEALADNFSGQEHHHLLHGDSTLAEIDQLQASGETEVLIGVLIEAVTEVTDESVESEVLQDEVTDRHRHEDVNSHLAKTTENETTVGETEITMIDDDQEVLLTEIESEPGTTAMIEGTTETDETNVTIAKNEPTAKIEKVRPTKTPKWTIKSKKNS